MLLSFLKKLFDSNERELRRIKPVVEAVNALAQKTAELSDQELVAKTQEFRERAARGEKADAMMVEAFAVVREASSRILDMRPFDCQVAGAVVLHEGRIAEMQTGEGKTLVATLPAYLNAVTGRTVHVVTVNDYLARFHSEWMGQLYRFLGLGVGLVIPGMDLEAKKKSYSCPIIYGTNTEFGFDYLRDNMAWRRSDLVQGDLDYAIIDEIDSILIDEARTPLIIAGPSAGSAEEYYRFRDLAKVLRRDVHYTVDEKAKLVALTEEGHEKAATWLGVDLDAAENIHLQGYIRQALKAKELMTRDVDYVLKDGQVLIVDEFTGRILPGRRYSDGLHQAIEAKEGLEVREEADTLATITVQNYFRMYKKLSGMTGTALTEEPEFREIYGLDVVVIPTNKPLIRQSLPDSIWKTEKAKYRAVVEEIKSLHSMGRPVLVGTRSIEKSEMLSRMLTREGIRHQVLNAKHHEREAEIVAQAGRKGAVTIATNMAGRGTDILLGGNPDFAARQELRRQGFDPEVVMLASDKVLPADIVRRIESGDTDERIETIKKARELYRKLYKEAKKITDREHEEVVKLSGLHVIGTERHEARRIDNQLWGRAGRQGDPGSSRFYLSLEDELMRLFGGDMLTSLMDRMGFPEDEPIEHNLVTKAVETAQKRIEAHNFGIRKNVLEYDNVLNKQREVIYSDRREVLMADDPEPIVMAMVERVVERAVELYWPDKVRKEEADLEGLSTYLRDLVPGLDKSDVVSTDDRDSLRDSITERAKSLIRRNASALGDRAPELYRFVILKVTDNQWVEQLRTMEDLREGIGLQAYGHKDPLVEYTRLGYEMFEGRIQNIEETVVRYLLRVEVKKDAALSGGGGRGESGRGPVQVSGPGNPPASGDSRGRQVVRTGRKVGRNDPCPCGSGKKYKNCCGKIA
ncbi:MAG: preprotein translocase subunit SecA [Firmicutes bacterium]|nr:preprotein translocase subunit SecA [Candidatus Fermentithermobacillaceae bacterium]